MADITTYPFLRHLRAEPTSHVLRYRNGRLRREGTGLALWFRPANSALAEVPVDDRGLPFLFRVRSSDFQELVVQGVIDFRVLDPGRAAARIDFTLDLRTGRWTQAPLEQVTGLLTQLAQQLVADEVARLDLRAVLAAGPAPLRARITAGLATEGTLADLGLEVVAVRVAEVAATAELEKALRQPTRESIQQQADEATFRRRALAVEKERAIAENELANRVELARREEELVGQEGANDRRRAEEEAAALGIAAEAEDERERRDARRGADAVDLLEGAHLRSERERAEIQAAMPPDVLLALALREVAGQLGHIDHLTLTPDLVAPLLGRLAAGAAE